MERTVFKPEFQLDNGKKTSKLTGLEFWGMTDAIPESQKNVNVRFKVPRQGCNLLVGVVSLGEDGSPVNLLAMNGTSSSLNFRTVVNGFQSFSLGGFPFINENTGRLCL